MLANIEQTSSRRRAISTYIFNTFDRCLLDRVNGVLGYYVLLFLFRSLVRSNEISSGSSIKVIVLSLLEPGQ